MKPNQFLGLIKFYNNEEYLDALLNGLLHCNTPEYYRLSRQEGTSDKHESCIFAYRQERGDEKYKLFVNGYVLDGMTALTLHGGKLKDAWLHCWTILKVPGDEIAAAGLFRDLQRLRQEFGTHYAFLPAYKLEPLIHRLRSVISVDFSARRVEYSENSLDWSPVCKSKFYQYQREFRFIVGNCDHTCVDPMRIQDDLGFSKYMLKSPEIKILADAGKYLIFSIDKNKITVNNGQNDVSNVDDTWKLIG